MYSVELFGNESAEDEPPVILNSYFVPKEEFQGFTDDAVKFRIARGKKGVGKSALLYHTAYAKGKSKTNLVVLLRAADFLHGGKFNCTSAREYLHEWQQRICTLINLELGKMIGFAVSDVAISIVEQSELAGFKDRNLISALLDRFSIKLDNLSYGRKPLTNQKHMLERFVASHKDMAVWLIVDDIDATYTRTTDENMLLATFFSACRYMMNAIDGLRIRCSVRDDVWATIYDSDEALDKCIQYIFDITWSIDDMRNMFAYRVASYRRLHGHNVSNPTSNNASKKLIGTVFPDTYPWREHQTEAMRVIHNYSAARPRWALQLCRMACENIKPGIPKPARLEFELIRPILNKYGELRISQVAMEHSHQCSKVRDLMLGFARCGSLYSTDRLLHQMETIQKKIKTKWPGTDKEASALELAHFLFRIGFISAVEKKGERRETIYRYVEKPYLLESQTNIDQGFNWRIHPAFYGALHIQ